MGTNPPRLPEVESPPLMPALDDVAATTISDIPLPQMVVEDLPSVRKEARIRINRLIQFLDATDPYVSNELEEENEHGDGDADDEPSLGASEVMNQETGWSYKHDPTKDDCELQNEDGDELDTLEGSDLEISGEGDGVSGGIVDDEPSLGSLDGRMSQLRWSQPDRSVWWPNEDMELDEAEQEVGIEDQPHDADEFH